MSPSPAVDRVPGLLTNNITLAQNLLLFLSGSMATLNQRFETWEPDDTKFLDYKRRTTIRASLKTREERSGESTRMKPTGS
jgi:hypothetical protein